MVKNPEVFEVSPYIESKLKVILSSTPSESAKGAKRPRRRRGRIRKRPLSNDAGFKFDISLWPGLSLEDMDWKYHHPLCFKGGTIYLDARSLNSGHTDC